MCAHPKTPTDQLATHPDTMPQNNCSEETVFKGCLALKMNQSHE